LINAPQARGYSTGGEYAGEFSFAKIDITE
jgi:hypothetical protein